MGGRRFTGTVAQLANARLELMIFQMTMRTCISKWMVGLFACLAQAGLSAADLGEAPLLGGLDDLKALDRQLVSISKTCTEATVGLVSKQGRGFGSGVIVSKDGLILTAAHVVKAMKGGVVVVLPDGSRVSGEVLGGVYGRDAAMVRITEQGEYAHVNLAESGGLKLNQWCIAMGHPGGFEETRTPPVRLGRILAAGEFIETDCAVVSGDSGGPLFDLDGRLIGINANIGVSLSENSHVPVAVFHDNWDDMLAGKKLGLDGASGQDRPVIGVRLADGDRGVMVEAVVPRSPAARAGIKVGDVIVGIAGERAVSQAMVMARMRRFGIGEKFALGLLRDGQAKQVEVRAVRSSKLNGEDSATSQEDDDARKERERMEALDEFLDDFMRGGAGKRQLKLNDRQLKQFGGMDRVLERIRERTGANPQVRSPKKGGKPDAPSALDLLDESLRSGKPLQLSPAQLKELGGASGIARQVRGLMARMSAEERAALGPDGPTIELVDPFYESVIKSLGQVTHKADGSTVEILVNGARRALGTVVSQDGWILTVNSEVLKGEVGVRLDGTTYDAKVIESFPKRDLALIRIEADSLKPVRWAGDNELELGGLLTSPSATGGPMGIGVVSVMPRSLKGIGYLGVRSGMNDGKLTVASVGKGSAADRGGLKAGDQLLSVNGEPVTGSNEFVRKIRSAGGDSLVEIEVDRAGVRKLLKVRLDSRSAGSQSTKFTKMNEMSGPLSSRIFGYPLALQHDMPLAPHQCGGPVLDLDGRCVGINVSRAGRVKTFAIPAGDIRPLLPKFVTPEQDAVDSAELEPIIDLIDNVQDDLSEIRQRLEAIEAR